MGEAVLTPEQIADGSPSLYTVCRRGAEMAWRGV